MGYLKERIKHVVRFRHKRGFGVHSPFMFNLILNVIRDKEKQFRYPEVLERENRLSGREKKVFRLLSRLVRYLNVRHTACFGGNAALLCRYLQEVKENVRIEVNDPASLEEADFIYLGRGFSMEEKLFSGLFQENRQKCIVIADIHRKGFPSRLWRQGCEKATVCVDMMWYGILFFNDRIQKGKYNLMI